MQNLEIKARYPRQRFAERLAQKALHAEFLGRLVQTDTYFNVPQGRLKLRRIQRKDVAEQSELIYYERPSLRSARTSSYEILPVEEGGRTRAFFQTAFGIRVVVHKVRRVFVFDNLRVHLDRVRGLGRFLEFELIVTKAHPLSACQRRMRELLELFEIRNSDLEPGSYADLLLARV